jgi:hypothetical protein
VLYSYIADGDSNAGETKAVTSLDNNIKKNTQQEVKPEVKSKVNPEIKPKVLTAEDIKENDRVSVYWPKDKQSYDATVRKIKKGGWYELTYDDGEGNNERFDKKKWKKIP